MTSPVQRPTRTLRGVYRFPRAEYGATGGHDLAEAAASGRIRETARKAGHEPGRVSIHWFDRDPDDLSLPEDPEWKWCTALCEVTMHAARARDVAVTCPSCGGFPAVKQDGTGLYCPTCD